MNKPNDLFDFYDYDSWKTTDPTWSFPDIDYREAQCGFFYKDKHQTCNTHYYEHDDCELGHIFEMPEPKRRNY